MSELTLKQVQGDNSAICGVPAGARIEHIRQDNKIEVRVGAQLITTFDLADGVVYLMNGAGKTIDKFETNGTPPKKEQPTDYSNPEDLFFTMHGVRYININEKTYRIPELVSNIALEAWDENDRVVGRTQLSKWNVMKQILQLGDLFGSVKAEQIKTKHLTSHKNIRLDLENAGAMWVDEAVHTCYASGWTLISSRNPEDLPAFNKAILKELESNSSV